MDFLASPIGVFIILAFVTIVALKFEPANPIGAWRELNERYRTDQRPVSTTFKGESVQVGGGLPNISRVDASLDDDGLWLIFADPDPNKASNCLFLPWDCVRYRQDKNGRQNFQLRGKDPIEFWVSPELGDAMQRRSLRFAIEDQL